MRLTTRSEKIYFCFFYAPGDHHGISIRKMFYAYLSRSYDKFASLGRAYLVGDTNARLGSFLNDRDVRGNCVSNRNCNLLMSFLEYSALTVLNRRWQFGVPTYEIVGKRRSIIDMCFTNSASSVIDFEVLPHFLGLSVQTCDKILATSIRIDCPPPCSKGRCPNTRSF